MSRITQDVDRGAVGQGPTGLDDSMLSLLRSVSTATLATQLFKRGLRRQTMSSVVRVGLHTVNMVGTAFTMRFIPSREDIDHLDDLDSPGNLQWAAFEGVPASHVLVVDSRGDQRAASGGDTLLLRAKMRGAAGFVTDGAVRDIDAIRALGLPVYAGGANAATRPTSFHVADLQVPIGCGGVAVYPGDVLVGDGDGVIAIPRPLCAEVARDAHEQEEIEKYVHLRIGAGEPLAGIYPPNAATRAAYEEWRRLETDGRNG